MQTIGRGKAERREAAVRSTLFWGPAKKEELVEAIEAAERKRISGSTFQQIMARLPDIGFSRKIDAYRFTRIPPEALSTETVVHIATEAAKIAATPLVKSISEALEAVSGEREGIWAGRIPPLIMKIAAIHLAMRHAEYISFAYRTKTKKEGERRFVIPERIAIYEERPYMVGKYHKKQKRSVGEIRSFDIQEMEEIVGEGLPDMRKAKSREGSVFSCGGSPFSLDEMEYFTFKMKIPLVEFFSRQGTLERPCGQWRVRSIKGDHCVVEIPFPRKVDAEMFGRQYADDVTMLDR